MPKLIARRSTKARPAPAPAAFVSAVPTSRSLLKDVRELIQLARTQTARVVNAGLVLLYWQIGQRIHKDILREKRAGYGKKIFYALSRKLVVEFGSGFTERNLANMARFAEVFPDPDILHALSAKLGWTHFRQIIYLDDPLQRDFYAEMCRIENWSTRTLQKKIQSMLFERTAISRKPAKLAAQELKSLRKEDQLTADLVLRDPYILDFLGLKDSYSEKDMEAAILREMESFILELGSGFAFVARQKRMQVDDRDYYLDLLFYHRGLRRLVAIDLKIGQFETSDKAQMELYLNWLRRHEQQSGEDSPIGIILCAGKRSQHIELLELEKSGIHVAGYLTKLLPRRALEHRFLKAIRQARARLANSGKGA
ncbi:PDDEXK nuclease domain-containing protein [Geminisphaera colitermitum]|uniref:PDDEXK nuclease domain-containing protein n=1 Tax=Geminisphaera colitermitum TaxID=1148786 RepID=UPI000158D5CC|nr:PDDEXK nuclease domain-containing protein [Geminisphaera colitermitum]